MTKPTIANARPVFTTLHVPEITYRGKRVVTTELLANGYGATEKNISDNFLNNKSRFEEGKHYFKVVGAELRDLKNRPEIIGVVGKRARSVVLWTDRGASRHAKMLETDLAWDYYEVLEEAYFRPRENKALPRNYEQALENLLAQVKENRIITEQRDRAVKEKRWISEKREVTAMATASAAVRAKNKLAERIGEGKNYAAIIPVEKKLGQKFKWQPLRKWCRENDTEPHEVEDPRFGTVKSWPRAAWMAVYDVDLRKIF
ncbi:ORF6N domain-containing protein [Leclercia adecarboxylata]|uniref:ORF6N domain-containing protein n=1 Tax=Leclercia adecarboxylata TaxID=83655 RepID=UPI0021F1275B|nr:ORF6N domain-containing protein [Leclercia adecarboxylata]UYM55316.1 ORF6N domain-containing protein [Leclercia adecarboxylata]